MHVFHFPTLENETGEKESMLEYFEITVYFPIGSLVLDAAEVNGLLQKLSIQSVNVLYVSKR